MQLFSTLLVTLALTTSAFANLSFLEKHVLRKTTYYRGGTFDIILYAIPEPPTKMSPWATLNLRDIETDQLIVAVQPNQTYTDTQFTDDSIAAEGQWNEYTMTFTVPADLEPSAKLYDPTTGTEMENGPAGQYTLSAEWRKYDANGVDIGPMSDYFTIFILLTPPEGADLSGPTQTLGEGETATATAGATETFDANGPNFKPKTGGAERFGGAMVGVVAGFLGIVGAVMAL